MSNQFEEVMAGRTDTELLKIVTGPQDGYQPAALEAAKKEFTRRNLSSDQVEISKQVIETEQKVKDEKANTPLGTGWKVLTFIFPGLIQLMLSGVFKADGYSRKSKELSRWTLYGFGFYIIVILLSRFL
ncbi:MAG: hypothetical protein V4642_01110 [Bacteroidota bacterium]